MITEFADEYSYC